jgi:hypothetical protein
MIGLWTPSLSARTASRPDIDSSSPDPITATLTPQPRILRRQTTGIPPRRFDEEQWDLYGGRALSAIGIVLVATKIPEGLKTW